MRVLAFVNQKGGCGKTTSVVNLASSLAESGHRVLVVDLDPQGHASMGFGLKPEYLDNTLFDALCPPNPQPLSVVVHSVSEQIDVAPSNLLLSILESKLAGQPGRELILFERLLNLGGFYDYVLIDSPPNLGLLTINALAAAGEVVVPLDTGVYSLHGLDRLRDTLDLIGDRLRHEPELHVLLWQFDGRSSFARRFRSELRDRMGGALLETVVPATVTFREAAHQAIPVVWMSPRSRAAKVVQQLSNELIIHGQHPGPQLFESDYSCGLSPVGREAGIHFSYLDTTAREVNVCGDFNDWSPGEANRLDSRGRGLFRKAIPVVPGTYRYRFVVDGRWIEDPHNPRHEPSPFGGRNSILEVT